MIENIKRDPDWGCSKKIVARRMKISNKRAQRIIDAEDSNGNGRSKWFLMRTMDGSLLLGCYPQGDTYSETEAYRKDL